MHLALLQLALALVACTNFAKAEATCAAKIGQFCDSDDAVKECPEGTASRVYRSNDETTCLPCALGTFAAAVGSIDCALCEANTISAAKGQSECAPCGDGQTTVGTGKDKCVEGSCPYSDTNNCYCWDKDSDRFSCDDENTFYRNGECVPIDGTNWPPSEFHIGFLSPWTGGGWDVGHILYPAMTLALEHVNQDSELLDGTILISNSENRATPGELGMLMHTSDDQCDGSQGITTILGQLEEDPEIAAIIGSGCSGVCMPAARIGAAKEIPVMSWGCSSIELSDKRKYPWFFRASETEGGSADFYVEEFLHHGYKTIAVITDQSGYTTSSLQYFVAEARLKGIEIIGHEIYEKDLLTVSLATALVERLLSAGEAANLGHGVSRNQMGFLYMGYERDWTTLALAVHDLKLINAGYSFHAMWPLVYETVKNYEGPDKDKLREAAVGWVGRDIEPYVSEKTTEFETYMIEMTGIHLTYAAFAYDSAISLALAIQRLIDSRVYPEGKALRKTWWCDTDYIGLTGPFIMNEKGDRIVAWQHYQVRPDDSSELGLKKVLYSTMALSLEVFPDVFDWRTPDNQPLKWTAPVSSDKPAYVNIGALFPFLHLGSSSPVLVGALSFAAFEMAVTEINSNGDGVRDDLLRETELRYAVRDTGNDPATAFKEAVYLTSEAFDDAGVCAVIGAGSSGPTLKAALVTGTAQIPQVAYASSDDVISDGGTYEYVLRTLPGDSYQGVALADIIKNDLHWTTVVTLATDGAYGSTGIAIFHKAADSHFIRRLSELTIPEGQGLANPQKGYADAVAELCQVFLKTPFAVIVLFMDGEDAGPLIQQLYDPNLGGCSLGGQGFAIVGSNRVTTNKLVENAQSGFRMGSNFSAGVNGREKNPDVNPSALLAGFIGVRAFDGRGTDRYGQFASRLLALGSTAADSAEECDAKKDDDGNAVYIHEVRAGSGSQIGRGLGASHVCTGVDFSGLNAESIPQEAAFVYDAVYSLAEALHYLIEKNDDITGPALKAAMLSQVNFAGVTGTVDFYEGEGKNKFFEGDRQVGASYTVQQYVPWGEAGAELATIGTWIARSDCKRLGSFHNCFQAGWDPTGAAWDEVWADSWVAGLEAQGAFGALNIAGSDSDRSDSYFIYSTVLCETCEDSAKGAPIESELPTTCGDGLYRDEDVLDCRVCPVGTYAKEADADILDSGRGSIYRCDDCPMGTHMPTQGATECIACSMDEFNGLVGQEECSECPAYTSREAGSSGVAIGECQCARASIAIPEADKTTGKQQVCGKGDLKEFTYEGPGGECYKPGTGAWLLSHIDGKTNGGGLACIACPPTEAVVCPGRSEQPFPAPGHWADPDPHRWGGDAEAAFGECGGGPEQCVGGENYTCGEAWHPTSRFCGQPADGYFQLSSWSLSCGGEGGGLTAVITQTCIYTMIFVGWWVINTYLCRKYHGLGLVLGYMQLCGVAMTFALRWPSELDYANVAFTISLFDVDIMTPGCFGWRTNFSYGFILQLILPHLLCLLVLVPFLIRFAKLKMDPVKGLLPLKKILFTPGEHLEEDFNYVMSESMQYVTMCYASNAIKCLSMFVCVEYPDGKSYLNADDNFECGTTVHALFQVVSVLYILAVVIGLPIYYVRILGRGIVQRKMHTGTYLERYGWLYDKFDTGCSLWELVFHLRLLFLVAVSVALPERPLIQAVIAIVVINVCLCLHFYMRPFLEFSLDMVEMVSLYMVAFFIFAGALFHNDALIYADTVEQVEQARTYLAMVVWGSIATAMFVGMYTTVVEIRNVNAVEKARLFRAKKRITMVQDLKNVIYRLKIINATGLRTGNSKAGAYGFGEINAAVKVTIGKESHWTHIERDIGEEWNASLEFTVSQTQSLLEEAGSLEVVHQAKNQTGLELIGVGNFNLKTGSASIDLSGKDGKSAGVLNISIDLFQQGNLSNYMGETELENTIRGGALLKWATDDARTVEDFGAYADVDNLMAYYISDESPTSSYSLGPTASVFRRLSHAFPKLIDFLALVPQEQVESFNETMQHLLDFTYSPGQGKGPAYASLVRGIDTASVVHFMCTASKESRDKLVKFLEQVVVSNPELSQLRNIEYQQSHKGWWKGTLEALFGEKKTTAAVQVAPAPQVAPAATQGSAPASDPVDKIGSKEEASGLKTTWM